MMQQELFKKTLERLKTDPLNRVSVLNTDPIKKIICNADAATLESKYGSVDGFFESIYKSGVKRIQIQDRRSHGSTNISVGDPYFFDFLPLENTTEVKQKEAMLEQEPITLYPYLNGVPGMQGGMNAGMNAAIYQQMDYQRVVPELAAAKADIKRLEADNKKMEQELLVIKTREGDSVAKTEANAKLMDSVSPILQGIAEKFLTKAPEVAVQGLTGAHFSPVKKQTLELINEASDIEASYLNLLMFNLDKDGLADDLLELFKKHQLIHTT